MQKNLDAAFQLRKSQNYQQAVDLYIPFWNEDPNQFDDWAGWSYAFCLSKLNRHEESLEVCRVLFPKYKSSEIIRLLYAKEIYYTQFTGSKPSPFEMLRKALRALFQLAPPTNPYSFTPMATFKLVKQLLIQQPINWIEIEEWLLKLDPDLLDEKTFTFTDTSGKTRELASPKEEWFTLMIRAKGGSGKPAELLQMLETARKQNFKWHYGNDLWFARKEAFALNELGEKEKAEAILRKIILQKKEWFLLFDLAQLVGEKQERIQLLCSAALSHGKNEMKIKVFEALFHNLKDNPEYQREAALHLCLVAALREENRWPVNESMLRKIQEMGITISVEGSSIKIIGDLIPFWKKISNRKAERFNGIIETVFPNNKAGFLRRGKSKIFFGAGKLQGQLKPGDKVSFETEDSFDKKKNRQSVIAVNLQIIK